MFSVHAPDAVQRVAVTVAVTGSNPVMPLMLSSPPLTPSRGSPCLQPWSSFLRPGPSASATALSCSVFKLMPLPRMLSNGLQLQLQLLVVVLLNHGVRATSKPSALEFLRHLPELSSATESSSATVEAAIRVMTRMVQLQSAAGRTLQALEWQQRASSWRVSRHAPCCHTH